MQESDTRRRRPVSYSLRAWCMALGLLAASGVALAAGSLKYPGDCDRKTLERAANKNGCSTQSGSNHITVKKGGKVITQIPHTVKPNGTCRAIIKILNEQCG